MFFFSYLVVFKYFAQKEAQMNKVLIKISFYLTSYITDNMFAILI